MGNTAETSVGAFLDALASGESTPGGGGASALTGSQAAALVSMVIRFTVGKKKYADVEAEMQDYLTKSEALREELLALADGDVDAFNAVVATYSMPKSTDEEKAARTAAMQSALKGAMEVSVAIAEASLAVIRLTEPVGAKGNSNVVSDAATAAYLGYAGLRGALINVNINLKFIKDEAYVAKWSAKRDALVQEADGAFARGRDACAETLKIAV